MSSRRGGGNSKGKEVREVNSPKVKQLSHGVADISLDSAQDDGEWAVISRKSKNRAGISAAKQVQLGPQNSTYKAWAPAHDAQKPSMRNGTGGSQTANSQKPAGGRNARQQPNSTGGFGSNFLARQHLIPPPLDHGWNWQSRAGKKDNNVAAGLADDNDDDNSDHMSDTDEYDDELFSDEFDSDSSEKSHGTRKQNRWFKKFFENLDGLSGDEIGNPDRQWHCPACKGGRGAIDWYQGVQPLKRHAETKGSNRVKLHREFAKILDVELQMRGVMTQSVAAGEVFGKWVGLKDEEKDSKIVWPPMVVITNTRLEKDESGEWIGMGTEELAEYFGSYPYLKTRHSYGPQGHCGLSILIFEASAIGHFEAELLHKNFAVQGLGRDTWDCGPILFRAGGIRQLYGYMAVKRDLDMFNQHTEEKSKLKFELRSYQEVVLHSMRQVSADSQQVIWLKDKLPKEQRLRKDAEETNEILRDKLKKVQEENRILKRRIKMQLEENKEEMDLQEEFYKDIMSHTRD